MDSMIIEYDGNKYKYLGNGCKATGADRGWRMSKDIFFRCRKCGYLMSGDPKKDDTCDCGSLYKENEMGRLGSTFGDDYIEVYCRA